MNCRVSWNIISLGLFSLFLLTFHLPFSIFSFGFGFSGGINSFSFSLRAGIIFLFSFLLFSPLLPSSRVLFVEAVGLDSLLDVDSLYSLFHFLYTYLRTRTFACGGTGVDSIYVLKAGIGGTRVRGKRKKCVLSCLSHYLNLNLFFWFFFFSFLFS